MSDAEELGPSPAKNEHIARAKELGEPIERKPRRHPGFGAMKGMTTIAPGVDLTEPACPEWADLIDEKYGKDSRGE